MAISRYNKTKNQDFDYHDTFHTIDVDKVLSNDDLFYVVKDRERIDQLARRFFNDGRYWWIICLVNKLDGPFDERLKPGTVLRITKNINNVLNKL